MKEVTEWNGKPRDMWCWDTDESLKCKGYVLCILTEEEMIETGTEYPVRTLEASCYLHCAEIEEEPMKETRLTNYEVGQLLKCFGVNLCYDKGEVYTNKAYLVKNENEEISEDYKIRYKQGEWEEPTRETVLKWYNEDLRTGTSLTEFVDFIGWDVNKE